MKLHSLSPAPGSIKKRKRIGRGQGSGRGGTSTRGHNGAQSRSGYKRKMGFEGGQMPLYKRIPKFGFTNPNRKTYTIIHLSFVLSLVEKYETKVLDYDFFLKEKLLESKEHYKIISPVKLTTAIELHAHKFSASVREAIEEAGGKTIEI